MLGGTTGEETLTCGVDVGGTKISAGVVDPSGRIVAELRRDTPAADREALRDVIVGMVDELGGQHRIGALGVGVAGFVDRDRSTVRFAPNLAWRDEPLAAVLSDRTGLPTVVENDANAAAWAEHRFGAPDQGESLLMLTVGTGIGGGLVLHGEVYRGAFGTGAEIGHLRVVPDGLRCGCGINGCLESYASGTALVRLARAGIRAGDPGAQALLGRAAGDVDAVDGPMITRSAEAGERFAISALGEVGRWLGAGIASLVAVLDPSVVLVGGGVAAAGDLLLEPARAEFQALVTGAGLRPLPPIRRAKLGNRAGLIGAADLARGHR